MENGGQKQVDGIIYTARWSSNPVVWVEPNSLSVLFAYCLPGEFADSGQQVLGGSQLEVLESYSLAVSNNLTGWLIVVENEDTQNRRLPAAAGVICVSDANDAQARVLSPGEQQDINNVIQQFITIQNTQISNIDQMINIINNVTEPTTTEPPLRPEIITNATTVFGSAFIKFDADVTGGTPPYTYSWSMPDFGVINLDRSIIRYFQVLGTHTFILNVTDSMNQTASDSAQIDVREQPLTVDIIPNATSGFTLDRFELKTNVRNGAETYTYSWNFVGDFQNFAAACNVLADPTAVPDHSCMVFDTDQAGTHEVIAYVNDSMGKTASDSTQITVRERPQGGLLGEGILDNATVAGEGLGGETSSPEGGGVTEEPGVSSPIVPDEDSAATPSDDKGGGGEGGTLPPSTIEEGEEPSAPPDDTEEGGGGEPPPDDEEESTTSPDGG